MAAPLTPEEFATLARHLTAAKMYSLASFVMLWYDTMLTFAQEVEQIWKRKFSMMSLLFLLNRYIWPLGFIVVTVSFQQNWSKEVCNRYILFPEAVKTVNTFIIGLIFIMRLYAIYSRSVTVAVIGGCLLAGEIAIKIWAFTDGTRVDLPPGLIGCILTGRNTQRFIFTFVVELFFDSSIFFMTLWRVIRYNKVSRGNTNSLINLILRDGVLYFGVIFATNVLTVLFILFAPPDFRYIHASFSALITTVMVSRLILNLRGVSTNGPKVLINGTGGRDERAWRPLWS